MKLVRDVIQRAETVYIFRKEGTPHIAQRSF